MNIPSLAEKVAPLVRLAFFQATVVVEAPLNTAVRVTVLPLSPAVLIGGVTSPENGYTYRAGNFHI